MKFKKFSLKKVSEFLTENEMKSVTGGYSGNGSGLCVITCHETNSTHLVPYANWYIGIIICGSSFSCNDECDYWKTYIVWVGVDDEAKV